MSTDAIVVRNLTKRFEVQTGGATSLKELVLHGFWTHRDTVVHEALKDVSFRVPWGRSLAVIGGNGSGKSTLLKLLTGITDPSEGTVEVHGRVAALLELGAGFQPDLTGMENIFLQGQILGLSRGQILERLDAVLDFCELGDFIHTPMKRYSSGMTVRLGFALAIHAEADVLLVDEVLSVGDIAFQQKCLRKMAALRAEGKTILFVSHLLDQVEAIADEALWLEGGYVQDYGPVGQVLDAYLEAQLGGLESADASRFESSDQKLSVRSATALTSIQAGHSHSAVRITDIEMLDSAGQPTRTFREGDGLQVRVYLEARETVSDLSVQIAYSAPKGLRLGYNATHLQGLPIRDLPPGRHSVTLTIPTFAALAGRYLLNVVVSPSEDTWHFYDLSVRRHAFRILGAPEPPSGAIMAGPGEWRQGE